MPNIHDTPQPFQMPPHVDHFQMIMMASTDAIYVKDLNLRYTIINPSGAQYFSRSPEEIIGKTDIDLFGEEVGQEIRDIDLYVMMQSAPFTYESTRDYTIGRRTVHTTKIPYRGADGEMVGLIGISRDITERKAMEESLLESEERFRQMFELSPDGIVVLDSESREILDCNSAYCEMNGYSHEELIGQSIDILRHDDLTQEQLDVISATGFNINEHAPTSESYTKLMREMGFLKFVTFHTRKDGSVFPVEISTTSIPRGGKPVVVGFDRDITERVRNDRERLEAGQLETALRKERELHDLKTKMMERVSHEFRTPLSLINTSSEFLVRYNERMTQEQRTERILMIRTQVGHLAKMLDGIASVVYDDLQQPPIRIEQVNIDKLCMALIDHAGGAVGMERSFEYVPAQAGQVVYTDEFSVSLILINLLSNAVKYSGSKSLIRVETDVRDEKLILKVKDHGVGMLSNEVGRIFEPFFRGSNFDERPGLGIGLTMVRNVINALEGTIEVESQAELGSTFIVTIPLQTTPEFHRESFATPANGIPFP